jgi:conjugative transfer pilus assembly protein TraH
VIDSKPAGQIRSENIVGYTGGSFRMRVQGGGTLKLPFHVEAPKLNIGCGGIDAQFGGLAYLKDSMVKMLQNVSSVAPAFAFQLGLKVLCSQCASTLQELQAIADQINAMAQDTCKLSKAAAGWAANQMGLDGKKGEFDGYVTKANDYLSGVSVDLDNFNKKLNSFAGDNSGKTTAEILKQGSLIRQKLATDDISSLNSMLGTDFVLVARAMVGDMVGFVDKTDKAPEMVENPDGSGDVPVGGGSSGSIKVLLVQPNWADEDTYKFIYGDGSDSAFVIKTIKVSPDAVPELGANPGMMRKPTVSEGTMTTAGLAPMLKDPIKNVLSKLGQPNGLTSTDADLQKILKLPVPMYKILNNEVFSYGSGGSSNIDDIANYVASIEATFIIRRIISSIKKAVSSSSATDAIRLQDTEGLPTDIAVEEAKAKLLSHTRVIELMLANIEKIALQTFTEKMQIGQKVKEQETLIKSQFFKSNILSRSAIYGGR